MAQKILKKLTIRDLTGGKAAILAVALTGATKVTVKDDATGKDVEKYMPEGKPVPLGLFIGQVTGIKLGDSKFDDSHFCELRGSFKATNLQTGEIVPNVGKCILPNFVGDLIAEAVKSANGQPVEFAVQINVRYVETAAVMYEFQAESHIPARTSDAVAGIEARLLASGVKLPQLAAPSVVAPAPAENVAQIADKAKGKQKSA